MALSRFFNKINSLQINKFWRFFENTPRPNFGNFFIGKQQQQKSLYSSDTKAGSSADNKCKKIQTGKDTKCPSFKLTNCPERYKYEAVCRKQPHLKECKKQEAPYPAYSDLCHTILEQKPSECKDCPYRPDPNYLPPKRRLHTSARLLSDKDKGKLPDCPTGPSAYNRADYNNPQPCNPKPDNTKNCPDDLLELKRKKPPRPKRPDH